MSYTPVELRHVRVGRSLLGYNRAMVEEMIEEVAESFEATWRERGELADRVEALEKQIVELRGREELLTHTLVAAERAASDVREQARRLAETIMSEAQAEARALLRSAQTRRETLTLESRRIEGMLRAALLMIEEHAPHDLPTPVEAGAVAAEAKGEPIQAHEAGSSEAKLAAAEENPAAPGEKPAAAEAEEAPLDATLVRPAPTAVPDLEQDPGPDPDGWPLEETGEFTPVGLPPVDAAIDQQEEFDVKPLLRRLAGGSSRDFDWGD